MYVGHGMRQHILRRWYLLRPQLWRGLRILQRRHAGHLQLRYGFCEARDLPWHGPLPGHLPGFKRKLYSGQHGDGLPSAELHRNDPDQHSVLHLLGYLSRGVDESLRPIHLWRDRLQNELHKSQRLCLGGVRGRCLRCMRGGPNALPQWLQEPELGQLQLRGMRPKLQSPAMLER